MKTINKRLFVKFDVTHNKIFKIGGLDLIRPDMWALNEKEDGTTQFESNTNKLLTHPQLAEVLEDAVFLEKSGWNADGTPKYIEVKYFKGQLIFLHYMAKEWEELIQIEGEDTSCVDADNVLFVITEDGFVMSSGVFLGDFEMQEAPRTESGIWLTPSDEEVKDNMAIKITHIPERCGMDYKHIKQGNIVLPMDKNNYVINYKEREYVVLKDREIMGVIYAEN